MSGPANVDDDDNDEDEDENFDKNQRTQKNDDLDWFAKLMRQKIEYSLQLLISRFESILQQYNLLLSQNQFKPSKVCEKQLSFLTRVTNSLFSYGMPSGTHRFMAKSRKSVSDDGDAQ
jgi:hypothetical protein